MTMFATILSPAAPLVPPAAPTLPATDLTPAVEALTTTLGGDEASKPSNDGPVKEFGATRVTLPPVDWGCFTIRERARADGLSDYTVYLYGAIASWSRKCRDSAAMLAQILDHAPEGTRVHLRIASPGGDVGIAIRLVAAMRRTKARVITEAVGMCASAGALLWSHGHERRMAPGSYLMLHMSSHGDWGNSTVIALTAEAMVSYIKTVALEPLVRDGVLTEEEMERIVDQRHDVYLAATTITERLEAARAVAA